MPKYAKIVSIYAQLLADLFRVSFFQKGAQYAPVPLGQFFYYLSNLKRDVAIE
jgi:hypothetical protein